MFSAVLKLAELLADLSPDMKVTVEPVQPWWIGVLVGMSLLSIPVALWILWKIWKQWGSFPEDKFPFS